MSNNELPTQDEVNGFLDGIKASGQENMFVACNNIMEKWPEVSQYNAQRFLIEWAHTYNERHSP